MIKIFISMLLKNRKNLQKIIIQLRRPPVFVFLIMLFIVVFGPLLAPYDPLEPKPMNTLAAPSWDHWFGTDNYGFDILSRVLYAARIDFSLALIGVLIGGGIGSLLGASAAYRGGITDFILLRFVEVVQSFPVLLFALALFAAFGGGSRNMVLVIAIVNIPMYLRIIRSSLLPLRTAEFVDAARCAGLNGFIIVIKHFIPNAKGQIFSLFVLSCAYAIQIIAGLSFIGLGVEPPHPEWGSMINAGAGYIMLGIWWPSIFPGLAIVISVYAINGLSREQMTDQIRS
jgi:peptide/nickel transport system permease protein|tara:strand:- start:226 stop:1080 length:855 start_codon:yes stop_codon:yes gene_type:complete